MRTNSIFKYKFKILVPSFLFFLLLAPFANSSETSNLGVPKGAISYQASSSEAYNESSKISGIEVFWNLNPEENFVWAVVGAYQNQDYGTFSESRYALGLSANYYYLNPNVTVNLGLKYMHYFGLGNTEEALDCLSCSNIEEDYSGKNSFVTLGFNFEKLYLGLDYRISDNKSEWSEVANDPWGVGSNYSSNYEGIPDPEYVINIGYLFEG